MTLLTFILSLALTFICENYADCQNIRTIEYIYESCHTATSTDAEIDPFIDYQITEKLTFSTSEGGVEVRENVYYFPFLQDKYSRDWKMAVALLARERGVEIIEYNDNVAVGYIPEPVLAAYMDIYADGFVNDMDSFDYLDERELSEQRTRYTAIFVSFSLFYNSVKMINGCFKIFHGKRRKGV